MLAKALLLKQLYLRRLCGERYCQNIDFSRPQAPVFRANSVSGGAKSAANFKQIVQSCALCELHKGASGKILGEISAGADITFITQKPVPPHSVSLDMLQNIAKRVFGVESYNLLSLIKCDTIAPIKPTHEGICLGYLSEQMKLADSKMFIIFGEEVAHFVLNNDENLAALRGRILHNANKRDFIVTFHISDLLKNQNAKKLAYEDFKLAKAYLANNNGGGE